MSRRNRNVRNKRARSRKRLACGLIGFFFILLIYSAAFYHSSSNVNVPQSSNLKAAIVDQLSLTVPNQTFIQTATNTLRKAGYTVDYYPGEEVTVEFYRNLPRCDYRIIVLRAHSAIPHHQSAQPTRLAIFTSEPYSKTKYVYEQLSGRLGRVIYREGSPDYFGIGPEFVKSSMHGKFNDTVIIMMGCEGLTYTGMAQAFIERGARVYIGWNGAVQADHTDQATVQLLKHLIMEKQTIKRAITETMKETGPDPAHKSLLIYYPLEAGEWAAHN